MASPTWDEYMKPVLDVLAGSGVLPLRDLCDQVAVRAGLSDDELRETIPSGQPRYRNRIGWAATHLTKAGALERPRRGQYAITERGRGLAMEDKPLTEERLMEFPGFAAFVHGARPVAASSRGNDAPESSAEAPEETIGRVAEELQALLEADLVDKLRTVDPLAFERLVLKVLRGMGYGKDGSLDTTKASHDEGIDGIISEDPLGLDRIYMQAKRYQDGSNVGAQEIRAFIGALVTHQGDRGVFITSSGFTQSARDAVRQANARIELIDGQRLAKLMVASGIGVQVKSVTTVYALDDDFFDDL